MPVEGETNFCLIIDFTISEVSALHAEQTWQ